MKGKGEMGWSEYLAPACPMDRCEVYSRRRSDYSAETKRYPRRYPREAMEMWHHQRRHRFHP